MTGLGTLFTPKTTGKTIATVQGFVQNLAGTVAGIGIQFGMQYGPTGGTPPAVMAALTGIALGATMKAGAGGTVTANDVWLPFDMTQFVTLVVGTQYWFDLANLDPVATGKFSFENPQWVIFEIP
jgi:hypothetical protein